MGDAATHKYIVSDKDVLSAINYAIAWNEGDEATRNLLIHVCSDIFGIDDEEAEELLDGYQDY